MRQHAVALVLCTAGALVTPAQVRRRPRCPALTATTRYVDNLVEERKGCEARLREIDALLDDESSFDIYAGGDVDYGYLSKSTGVYTDLKTVQGEEGPPPSAFVVAPRNFLREAGEILNVVLRRNDDEIINNACAVDDVQCNNAAAAHRYAIESLTLDDEAIWARERARTKDAPSILGQSVDAPLVLLAPYLALCALLDGLFEGRPIARFWFLESVARMPYFSYISMLHLYESLGWWRRSAVAKKTHFAEEWNEFHHLLCMEALGGDAEWRDRFAAQHASIVYYWVLVGLWVLSPNLAYTFSELIEAHAVDTYAQFVDENRAALAELPAPRVIRDYYERDSLFDTFQTGGLRDRPQCETLLDAFESIRDDEKAHVATMGECLDPDVARRARTTEVITAVLIACAVVPVVYFFGRDELCLLEECGRPENAEFLSEFGL